MSLLLMGAGGAVDGTPVASTIFDGISLLTSTSGTGDMALPATAKAGDLFAVWINNNSNSGISPTVVKGTGRNMNVAAMNVPVGASWNINLHWIILQAADISNGFFTLHASAGAEVVPVCYSGPTSLIYHESVTGAIKSPTLTFNPYTPDPKSAGFVFFVAIDRNQDTPNTLAGWVFRLIDQSIGAFFRYSALDMLAGYASSSVTLTGFGVGGFNPQPFGTAVELVHP